MGSCNTPISVFREWQRHRIASYNEESARYRELRPSFHLPAVDRNLVQVGKPGAYRFEPGTAEQLGVVDGALVTAYQTAFKAYEQMLAAGIAREIARAALPVGIYSSMYVTMNPRGLMNFLSLRAYREDAAFVSNPQREVGLSRTTRMASASSTPTPSARTSTADFAYGRDRPRDEGGCPVPKLIC
ncbi:hypothetical protein GCM10009535_05250 [Streptomyces thermocarboxydovorans]|uniref:FAD-dependent thymidylate synthase n=1 Tax=Streptomyces thermocarboxydovorans TaxID=59298 RepID=A0ABN1H826_9ACTN